jgi:hypothetical protein
MTDPGLFPIRHGPVSDANRLIAFLAEKHHIGDVKRGLFLHDAPPPLLAVGTHVPLDEIDLFHDQLFFFWKDFENPPTFPFFLPRGNHDQVILSNMKFWNDHDALPSESVTPLPTRACRACQAGI